MQPATGFFFVLLFLTPGVPADKEDEQDIFELWMAEAVEDFNRGFQELINNKEINNPDGKRNSVGRAMMSQNTVDRFQELVASMRKDVTDEFWKFMRGMQTEMESAFEGFMRTIEKEMDANFDDFMTNIMGTGDTRLASDDYNAEFQQWKTEQIEDAYRKFVEYTKEQHKEKRAKVHNQPIIKRDKEQSMETPIIEAAAPVSALITDGQSKANQNSVVPGSQTITGAIPSPIKDRIPGMLTSVGNSAGTPTLFIGGFSVLMMPMPNGLENMQQLMQGVPNAMNMIPLTSAG